MAETYIVIGAGVVGLTTALELKTRIPSAKIVIIAKHIPGDQSIEYTSPWAGADWYSFARDNGPQESWDRTTYHKLHQLASTTPESGILSMNQRVVFDESIEDAGILTPATGKIWYEELVGLRFIPEEERPEGTVWGFEMSTFQINVPVYLNWLFAQVMMSRVVVHRASLGDIGEVFGRFPNAKAVFNCTGLGSRHLKGVEDQALFPTKGQVILVESPEKPLKKIYNRPGMAGRNKATYIMPRGDYGGVILGGCRLDGVWDGTLDLEIVKGIKERCCALCPDLGPPEKLNIISHGVGLRPSRKGGARIEKESIDGSLVIHNYGAGGGGYQASWGMAREAVDLLL